MCSPRCCVKFWKKRILNCWIGCKTPTCTWGGCCKCPHGCCYTGMGVMGAFGALWMNMYVLMSCKFQRITELHPVTGEPIPSTKRGYGLIAREVAYGEEQTYQGCILYGTSDESEIDYMYDAWLKWARNFAYLAGIMAMVCFITMILSYCYLFSPWTFERWILWCYIYGAMCIAMTMLMYGTHHCQDNKCKVANGTGYAISCFFVFLMMANQVKAMGQPPPQNDMPPPGGREDDYWYDDEEDRFPEDRSASSEEQDDDLDEFEDDYEEDDDRPQRPWRRRRRRNKDPQQEGRFQNGYDPDKDGVADTTKYDEMQPHMAPEDDYAPATDDSFLQRDMQAQERFRQEQEAEQRRQQELQQQQQQQQQQQDNHNNGYDPNYHQHQHSAAPAPFGQQPEGNMGVGYDDDQQQQPHHHHHHQQPQQHQQQQQRRGGPYGHEDNNDDDYDDRALI